MTRFKMIKEYYKRGLWSKRRVLDAVKKGWITQEECDEILSEIGGRDDA